MLIQIELSRSLELYANTSWFGLSIFIIFWLFILSAILMLLSCLTNSHGWFYVRVLNNTLTFYGLILYEIWWANMIWEDLFHTIRHWTVSVYVINMLVFIFSIWSNDSVKISKLLRLKDSKLNNMHFEDLIIIKKSRFRFYCSWHKLDN